MEQKRNFRPRDKQEQKTSYENKVAEIAELFKNEKIAQVVIHAKENTEPTQEGKGLTSEPDFDTRMALYLLNDLNKKSIEETYTDEARTSFIIKGGNETNLQKEQHKEGLNVFVDVGGSFIRIQKNGKETLVKLDHHGTGQRGPTSATQMMYDILQKADLLNTEDKWVKNLVNTVNSIDNLNYVNRKDEKGEKIWNEEYFKNEWPYSVEAIAEHLPLPTLIQLYKENKIRNSAQVFTDTELDNIIRTIKPNSKDEKSIVDIIKDNKENATKTLQSLQIAIELNKKNGLETEDTIIGKTIYHNYEKIEGIKSNNIPFKTAYLGTKALGYDSFAGFNPDPKKIAQKFFVNSTHPNTSKLAEQLNRRLPGTLDIRGTFIFPPKNTKDLKNFKEEDFIKQLIPRQKINPRTNKKEKEIPSKPEEDKKGNTETKIKEEVSPEIIPQTARQKRIAELLENQEKRTKKIEDIENEIKKLKVILEQMQKEEIQGEISKLEEERKNEIENMLKENRVEITDENFELQIFGAPDGFNIASLNEETFARNNNYYQLFYTDSEYKRDLLLEKKEDKNGLVTYSYVYKVNADFFTSEQGRSGAFFGMGVELENIRITDLDKFKNLLEETFQKLIIEKYKIVSKRAPVVINNTTLEENYHFETRNLNSVKTQITELKGIIRKNLQTVLKNDILKQNKPLVKNGTLNLTNAKSKVFDFERNEINAKYDKKIAELNEKILGKKANTEIQKNEEGKVQDKNEEIKEANNPEVQKVAIENKEGQIVKIMLNEKGIFDEKSIMRYFAEIFYEKRKGFSDLTDEHFNKLTPETKDYFIKIYNNILKNFEIENTILKENINNKEKDIIAKSMLILSFDAKNKRGNGMTDGVNSPSKIQKIEYPSNEVLKNLDEVFNGNSSYYDAELKKSRPEKSEIKENKNKEKNFESKKADIERRRGVALYKVVFPSDTDGIARGEFISNKITEKIRDSIVRIANEESIKGDSNYQQKRLENFDKVNAKYEAELAELETKSNNPEIKRDGRENYEGWNTSYHHDIEADDKSLRIKNETNIQTGMSRYELKVKGDEMVLFLIESKDITKTMIDYADGQLKPFFNLPDNLKPKTDIVLIKTVKPAKFKKEGEFWVLEEKGEVEYIK